MEGVYALDDSEAVTYASECAGNKRYQVAIDAWEPISLSNDSGGGLGSQQSPL
jgi:hypothetical protein